MAENSAEVEKPIESGDSTDSKPTEVKKGLSIVALIFGILGIVSCWTGFFALACCLVGVIVGIVALVKKSQKGMAIAGLICGALGLIPAIIFSIVWGGAAMLFGGVSDYASDPVKYCEQNPNDWKCDEDSTITINGQTIDNKKTDSSDDNTKKEDDTKKNTSKTGSGWTLDYLKEVAKEKGVDYADIPDGYKIAFNDFEVCLDDAGIKVSSWDEFEALNEDSDDLSMSQAMGLLSCAMELSEATEGLDDDIDIDL